MVSLDQITALIAKHEEYKATAYHDSQGVLRIGYGTSLDGVGVTFQCTAAGVSYLGSRDGQPITQPQALLLMQKAALHARDCCNARIKGFDEMPANVQLAAIDMMYSLGFPAFSERRKMIHALEAHDWTTAAYEMRSLPGLRGGNDIALVESAIPVTA